MIDEPRAHYKLGGWFGRNAVCQGFLAKNKRTPSDVYTVATWTYFELLFSFFVLQQQPPCPLHILFCICFLQPRIRTRPKKNNVDLYHSKLTLRSTLQSLFYFQSLRLRQSPQAGFLP